MSQDTALKIDQKELDLLVSAEEQLEGFKSDFINSSIMQRRSLLMVEKVTTDIMQMKQSIIDKYGEGFTLDMKTGELKKSKDTE